MRTPPIGLNQSTLDVLASLSLDRGRPISDAWFRLTSGLDKREAQFLPDSIGQTLPLLAAEDERTDLVADLAVAYDLYEVAEYLVDMAIRTSNSTLLLAAAAFAGHPGAPPSVRQRLAAASEVVPAPIASAFEIRLTPDVSARSDLESELLINRWPGKYGLDDARQRSAPPMVGVIERGLPRDFVFRIAYALRNSGAQVRRVPPVFRQEPSPAWLAPWMPLVGVSADDVHNLRRAGLNVTGGQLIAVQPQRRDARSERELLRRIDEHFYRHGLQRLHLEGQREAPTLESSPLDIGVFTAGALDARETAFLTANSTGSVYRWAKKLGALEPRRVEGFSYWAFNQLVAMRAYRYMSELSGRRISTNVITALAEYSGREEPVDIAVTSTGDILPIQDAEANELFDIASGQGVWTEVIRLDEVFRPFPIGGGNSAPGLTRPTPNTRVHPTVQGGTPTLVGTRIPCRTVATLAQRRGIDVVNVTYPGLASTVLGEAIEVGGAILP